MAAKMKPFVPEIAEMPSQLMAVVHTTGDPTEMAPRVFPALYGAAYALKFALKKQGIEFKVEAPRARWLNGEDWEQIPRDEWRAVWALPVPEGTSEVVQKDPETPVTLEVWEYGTVAQILHEGPYSEEPPTIEKLHAFIAEQGYEISGDHEEVYLSRPGAKSQKTIVRMNVRKPR